MSEPVIFFSSPPVLEDLCAMTICATKQPQQTTSQPHVLKCREFIFSENNIIASPSFDLDGCFNIIMQISLCKTGRLQGRMQKLGLKFSKPFRVHPTLFQSCLRYTVTARLAPSWNKAGEWHIQGRDFVAHRGCANAIKINLCVNKDEIFASLCGAVLRFPPLQVEDLNLSRQEMLNILKSTQEDGRQVELLDSWCYVLPSMKRGRIMSVSLLMPSESPFSGYNELKRHWKNMYGYRLPDTDEDILYCQVSFLPSGSGKHFTYPDICLRNRPAQCTARIDCKPVLTSFIQDLHARVGHICGQPLRFTPKMHFTSVSLHDANEEVPHASLSNKRKIVNGKPPLRSSQNIMQTKQKSYSQQQPSLRNKIAEQAGVELENKEKQPDSITNNGALNTSMNNQWTSQNQPCSNGDVTPTDCENREFISSNNTQTQPISYPIGTQGSFINSQIIGSVSNITNEKSSLKNNLAVKTKLNASTENTNKSSLQTSQMVSSNDTSKSTPTASNQSKLIPIFRPQKKCGTSINESKSERNSVSITNKLFTPMFKSKQSSSSSSSLSSSLSSTMPKATMHNPSSSNLSSTQQTVNNRDILPSPSVKTTKPLPSPNVNKTKAQLPASTTTTTTSSQLPPTTQPTKLFPVFKPKSKPVVLNHHQTLSQPTSRKNTSLSSSSSKLHKAPLTKSSALSLSSKDLQLPTDSPSSHWKGKADILPSISASYTGVSPGYSSSLKLKTMTTSTAIAKRKIESAASESSPVVKKLRTKPQVQNLDIEALARSNQLSKANTATLITWLKERGVNCRSKDKKTDLVEKVQTHLNISLPEP